MLFTDERYKFKGTILKLNFFMVAKKALASVDPTGELTAIPTYYL